MSSYKERINAFINMAKEECEDEQDVNLIMVDAQEMGPEFMKFLFPQRETLEDHPDFDNVTPEYLHEIATSFWFDLDLDEDTMWDLWNLEDTVFASGYPFEITNLHPIATFLGYDHALLRKAFRRLEEINDDINLSIEKYENILRGIMIEFAAMVSDGEITADGILESARLAFTAIAEGSDNE